MGHDGHSEILRQLQGETVALWPSFNHPRSVWRCDASRNHRFQRSGRRSVQRWGNLGDPHFLTIRTEEILLTESFIRYLCPKICCYIHGCSASFVPFDKAQDNVVRSRILPLRPRESSRKGCFFFLVPPILPCRIWIGYAFKRRWKIMIETSKYLFFVGNKPCIHQDGGCGIHVYHWFCTLCWMRGATFCLQMFPKARPRHLEGSLLKSVGAHLGKCPLKIFQWLKKSVWVVFCVVCQEIFWDVVKWGSSILEDLRKMKSSPENLRLAEQDDKSGYQLHLLRQCSGFPGVLGTNTADAEGWRSLTVLCGCGGFDFWCRGRYSGLLPLDILRCCTICHPVALRIFCRAAVIIFHLEVDVWLDVWLECHGCRAKITKMSSEK